MEKTVLQILQEMEYAKADVRALEKRNAELSAQLRTATEVAGNLHVANLERIKLVEWRNDVTAALGMPGGCRFDAVPDRIRNLRRAYLMLAEAVMPGWNDDDVEAASPSAISIDAKLHREAWDALSLAEAGGEWSMSEGEDGEYVLATASGKRITTWSWLDAKRIMWAMAQGFVPPGHVADIECVK